ncbi:MAG: hypothetical protein WAP19_04160 [Caldicoprobacterales bacterium]
MCKKADENQKVDSHLLFYLGLILQQPLKQYKNYATVHPPSTGSATPVK